MLRIQLLLLRLATNLRWKQLKIEKIKKKESAKIYFSNYMLPY